MTANPLKLIRIIPIPALRVSIESRPQVAVGNVTLPNILPRPFDIGRKLAGFCPQLFAFTWAVLSKVAADPDWEPEGLAGVALELVLEGAFPAKATAMAEGALAVAPVAKD